MKEIKLTQNKIALVSEIDFEKINQYKWHYHNAGYALRTCHEPRNGGKQKTSKVYMHHAIMGKVKGKVVDHIDHNTLNNCRENLRICSISENHMNVVKSKKNKSSIYKGVYLNKREGRWYAKAKGIWIGIFDIEKEAAIAYNKKASELFGEFALLNKI